jgi:hypothetical protein
MSADYNDSAKVEQPQEVKQDEVKDINDAKVSDKDASELKGGRMPLNPQPLPPSRH